MGGQIQVQSKDGQGSTFHFTILAPACNETEPAKETIQTPPSAELWPLRILLAEDNAVNRVVALKLLQKLGYAADIAINGLEAAKKAQDNAYDLILMDMQMPEMGGVAATLAIRAQTLAMQPRIVGLTANAFDSDREACFAAGMDAFITKPISVAELKNQLSITCETVSGQNR